MPTHITKFIIILLITSILTTTLTTHAQTPYTGQEVSTNIQYSQTIISRDIEKREYTKIVDGDDSDWLGQPPTNTPSSTTDNNEFIITDPTDDTLPYRKDNYPILSDLDIKEFRLAVDDNNLYLLIKFKSMINLYSQYVMIAIDTTPLVNKDGFSSWLPDWSDTELGCNAVLEARNSVGWDHVIGINYDWNDDPNHKYSRIVVWDDSWEPVKPVGAKVVFNKDKALIEASVPRSYLPDMDWQPVMPRFRIWVVVFANKYGGIWDPYEEGATDEYGNLCLIGSDVYDVAGQDGTTEEFYDEDGDPSNDVRILGDDHWVDKYFTIIDLLFMDKGSVECSITIDLVLSGVVKFRGSVSGDKGVIEILDVSTITPQVHVYGWVKWTNPLGFEVTRDFDKTLPLKTTDIPCSYTSQEVQIPVSDTPIVIGVSVTLDVTVYTKIYDGVTEIASREHTTMIRKHTVSLANREHDIYIKPMLKAKPGVNITVYLYIVPIYNMYQELPEVYSIELDRKMIFERMAIETTRTQQTSTTIHSTTTTPQSIMETKTVYVQEGNNTWILYSLIAAIVIIVVLSIIVILRIRRHA